MAIAPEDLPVDLADFDEFDGPEFDFMDEVADLSIEEQAAFETRRGLPWRLRMTSGFAADTPLPANDLARDLAKAIAATLAPVAEAVAVDQP